MMWRFRARIWKLPGISHCQRTGGAGLGPKTIGLLWDLYVHKHIYGKWNLPTPHPNHLANFAYFWWRECSQSVMVSIATSARGCAAHSFLVEICPASLEVLDSLDCCLRRSRGGSCSSCAVVSVASVDEPSMPDRVF